MSNNSKPRSVAFSAGIVSLAVMGSRVLGLVRELIFAAFFGAGFATDAFIIAFRIPNLLRDLFGEGALSAAFVTTFTSKLNNEGEESAWRLANLVNNGLFIILSVIALLGILFSPQIVHLLMDMKPQRGAFDPVKAQLTFDLAVQMTRIMFTMSTLNRGPLYGDEARQIKDIYEQLMYGLYRCRFPQ